MDTNSEDDQKNRPEGQKPSTKEIQRRFLEQLRLAPEDRGRQAGGGAKVDEQASASELESDVDQGADAKKLQKYYEEKRDAEVARLKSDNLRRQIFFGFVLIVAGIPVAVASVVMGVLLYQGKVTDTIAVAYFASVVLEVIGLAVIIARYLFPNGGSVPGESADSTGLR